MSELVYTPSSMLKKVFRTGERSLSRQELENRLQNTYGTSLQRMNQSPAQVIDEALAEEISSFHVGASHAVIEMEAPFRDLIAEELVRYFLESKGPLTAEQCLKKLRRQNIISYSYAENKLPLYKDSRFVQFTGSDLWYLARWEVANDRVYRFLANKQIKQLPLTQLLLMMEHELNLSRRDYVFVPEGDSRLRVIEGLVLVDDEAKNSGDKEEKVPLQTEEVQATALDQESTAITENIQREEEVAVTMANDMKTVSVFEDVLVNAQDSTEKLEQRIKEMEEEVLEHFKGNNMSAISTLVAEKEKCEAIVVALEKVVEAVNK
ncbi:hypothetical protein [Aneurinibacillus aneurinilyticus]|uniref:Uncharacterized protein n=1 Tax=Aneurinibacillus aneurinilyticus TaxID=1391 RepID=A0A848CLA6_ANEAE|nr:hypothetical protein [Aneurinibacillus aneurinilyticus]MED0670227.1 hypothetical protein [Aneurinibacillus aneurinilyticus]NME96653.1 hypothetical protein [Aneurinibacillus aneurinilyticus]